MCCHEGSASAHIFAPQIVAAMQGQLLHKCMLPQDAQTDREPNSEGDDRTSMSQQSQLITRRRISGIEWTNYVRGDPGVRRRESSNVAIFKAPKFLKNKKEDYYVPQRVSLGPLHHGIAELLPMENHKGRALRGMMKRCNVNGQDNMVFANHAMGEILKLDNEIRDSYEENIDCDEKTLARMLCLDGCFLLQVLRTLVRDTYSTAEACKYYDPIFGEKKLGYAAKDVVEDIMILENQIPLIILRKLLELELDSAVEVKKHLNLLMRVITAVFNPFDNKNIDKEEYWSWLERDKQEVHHLLGFLHTVIASPPFNQDQHVDEDMCSIRIHCLSRMLRPTNKARHVARIPRAVELSNAGIKFKQSDGVIKEIKFDGNRATIFLPPITFQDHTERVFRNLIAYEMCKPSEINYVSSYVSLMNNLIDTKEDVALMRKEGVLSNWLESDKEVADLVNGLGKELVVGRKDLFEKLKQNVSAHYSSKWKVQCAEVVRAHFSSPWQTLALVGSIVMLVLTALQTIYTMK